MRWHACCSDLGLTLSPTLPHPTPLSLNHIPSPNTDRCLHATPQVAAVHPQAEQKAAAEEAAVKKAAAEKAAVKKVAAEEASIK